VRGINTSLAGELRKLRFLFGSELDFHTSQTIEKTGLRQDFKPVSSSSSGGAGCWALCGC
jgi:hypothetical protein